MSRVILGVIAVGLAPALRAGATYDLVDLGLLSGGSFSQAAALSGNGKVAGSADASLYTAQPFLWTSGSGVLGLDPVNSTFAFGLGVNSSGVVVGYELDSTLGVFRAFRHDGLSASTIDTLGGSSNAALAINNAGIIVGYSEDGGGATLAFSSSAGAVTALGTLAGGSTSSANAINNSGDIVGESDTAGSTDPHAFLLSGGVWTDLGVLSGFTSSKATAISDAGHVAGILDGGADGSRAFLWTSGGAITQLGVLAPGGTSKAYGVNSGGLVVGTSDGVAFLYSAVLLDLNTLLDPAVTGWQLTEAMAINDAGQIAGTGFYQGEQHAFLLTPSESVPEPSTVLLLGAGLAFIAWRKTYAAG